MFEITFGAYLECFGTSPQASPMSRRLELLIYQLQ